MLKAILNFLGGGIFDKVTDGLLQAQRQHLESQTKESEQNLKFWQSRMDMAIATSQSDKWWSPRTIMGWCATAYVFKTVVWDSLLGLGVTQYPGEQVTFFVMTIVGFYFASKAAENIATILSGRMSR